MRKHNREAQPITPDGQRPLPCPRITGRTVNATRSTCFALPACIMPPPLSKKGGAITHKSAGQPICTTCCRFAASYQDVASENNNAIFVLLTKSMPYSSARRNSSGLPCSLASCICFQICLCFFCRRSTSVSQIMVSTASIWQKKGRIL